MTWGNRTNHKEDQQPELFVSSLYNEDTFCDQFILLPEINRNMMIQWPYNLNLEFKGLKIWVFKYYLKVGEIIKN